MSAIDIGTSASAGERVTPSGVRLSGAVARPLMLALVLAAFAGGFLATDATSAAKAVADAGDDLTRLLRFMAAIKAVPALGAAGAVLWRLGVGASLPRFAAYGLACGAMSAGPGLIWAMAHVGLGALLLHGGLAACVVMLWRDPAVAGRMQAALIARRLPRSR